MTESLKPTDCPCGLESSYVQCCGRWHSGPSRLLAPDAEHLMRSRYSAYVVGDLEYLLDTWHPSTRPSTLDPDPPDLRWLGLDVRQHVQRDDRHAIVEFVVRYRHGGRVTRLHEISRFERVGGRWVYIDGLDASSPA